MNFALRKVHRGHNCHSRSSNIVDFYHNRTCVCDFLLLSRATDVTFRTVSELWRRIGQNFLLSIRRYPILKLIVRGKTLNPRPWILATRNLNDYVPGCIRHISISCLVRSASQFLDEKKLLQSQNLVHSIRIGISIKYNWTPPNIFGVHKGVIEYIVSWELINPLKV